MRCCTRRVAAALQGQWIPPHNSTGTVSSRPFRHLPQTVRRKECARSTAASSVSPSVLGDLHLHDSLPSASTLSYSLADDSMTLLLATLTLRHTVCLSPASTPHEAAQRHALFFAILQHPACDVRLVPMEAASVSVFSAAATECVEHVRRHHLSRLSASPHVTPSLLSSHVALASALIDAAQHPEAVADARLALDNVLRTTAAVPDTVLISLLSLPTAVELLHTLLLHFLERSTGGAVDAHLFRVLLTGLLNNDNFFFPSPSPCGASGLAQMDDIIRTVVLRGVALQAKTVLGFDYVSVRWTPLMNKWARIYTKQNEGERLYDDFQCLLEAIPSAEAKIPCSFHVRLIGALIDRGQLLNATDSDGGTVPGDELLWEKVVVTARRAVRLFGRQPSELRAIWIVLMKAALTLPSRRTQATRRLLGAYLLCAEQDHPVPVDRAAVMQLTRLTSDSVLSRWVGDDGTAEGAREEAMLRTCETMWVAPLCRFMQAYPNVSFLWLLDGVGMVVSALWTAHGAAARGLAASLCRGLEAFLQRNGVTGVSLSNNPSLADAMDHFQLGERAVFWWRCGCGARLASSSKRCVECLRSSGGGVWWMCPSCGEHHSASRHQRSSSPATTRHCETGRCTHCHGTHPRVQAALQHGVNVCSRCGEVTDAAGHCARCNELASREEATVQCTRCACTHTANALYCPQCFLPNPEKPPLRVWLCEHCQHFNLSTWSQCQTCEERTHARRRTDGLTAAFAPWRCGCGAINHPCRTACAHCTEGKTKITEANVRDGTYTCTACLKRTSLRSHETVPMPSGAVTMKVHLCEHCDHVHPRDALVLYSSSVPRHCMLCGTAVPPETVNPADGSFVHCQTVHTVNEVYPFRCDCVATAALATEDPQPTTISNRRPLQSGYDCRFCGQARPELCCADNPSRSPFYVWRCLHEVGDDHRLCGAWNYSWASTCAACGGGRVVTVAECRARAEAWQCPLCQHHNRPTDVLLCRGCGIGLHQIAPCVTCGSPHLTFACL